MKKGFTLVELLAVISIIAILVIIAMPNVLKLYNKAKEDLRIQTVRTYINEAKKFYLKEKLNNSNLLDGETNVIDEIKIDGKEVDDGFVVVSNKGEIKVALEIEGKCYKNNGDEISVEENYIFCDVVDNRIKDETPGVLAGNGTSSNPYKIESVEDLILLANMINNQTYNKRYSKQYILFGNNLDLSSKYSYNNYKTTEFGDVNSDGKIEMLINELNTGYGMPMIGTVLDDDREFIIDGNNKTIKNLTYDIVNTDPSKTINVSLFGLYEDSTIKNLNLENINITVDTAGNANIGPLVRNITWYDDYGITNINVTGKINAKCGETCNVGGASFTVFSYGRQHAVSNVHSSVDIIVDAKNAVVGGIMPSGSNYGFYSLDSSYTGNITVKATNNAYVGGIRGNDNTLFYAVNTAVNSNINVETKGGIVHGIGRGNVYNSYFKGNINVKSAVPLDTSMIGDGEIKNSYALGNIIIDANKRDDWPRIGGLNSQGTVYNSYYIGDIYYKTITSYGGGGPTVYASLLTGEGSATNSFVRGKITNEQKTTYSTYFGYLTTHEKGDSEPTLTNSYYTSDTSYTGNASLYKGGIMVNSESLKNTSWYKNELNIGEHWKLTDGYYPQLYRCEFNSSTKECTPTTELLPNQILTKVQ